MSLDQKKQFNSSQSQAITHQGGPLLIIAGAGTGKTTVLVERLNYLITQKLAASNEILITTFTEKAAGEMENRADQILPYGCVDLWIHTFHGFGERLLRQHALDIGLPADFKLLTQTEEWIFIKKNLDKLQLDYYRPLGNQTKFIHELIRHFSRLKDENISPQEYLDYAQGLDLDFDNTLSATKKKSALAKSAEELEVVRLKELASAYYTYNQLLLENSFFTFGDLIFYALKLLKKRPNILQQYQTQFKYLMVDEFQDTNFAQYELIKLLAGTKKNLTVVGDDDQAIYKFRGASLSNIMQFKDDFPEAREVVLSMNYRSGQNILDHAYKLITHNNPNRLEVKLEIDKKLISGIAQIGLVEHYHAATEAGEVEMATNKIVELYQQRDKAAWSDFAILVRANDTADKFVAALTRKNIPNQFVSLKGLYYKPIILDLLAYLRLLDNYHESSALWRVLNMASFKVEHADIIAINRFARNKAWSTFEALEKIQAIPDISAESVANINKLLGLIKKHAILASQATASKVFLRIIYDAEVVANLDYDKNQITFSYLNQFYRKIKSLEENTPELKVKEFIEVMDLEQDAGETGKLEMPFEDVDTVKIMTVHAAKGLEFKYVFIPDLVDKRFPTIQRGEKITLPDALVRERPQTGDTHLEEERRLFYVAVTRAKEELYLYSAADYGGARDKKISHFLVEFFDNPGLATSLNAVVAKEDVALLRDLDELESVPEIKKNVFLLPERFSFSQLEAYANCPLQYKFNFILKIPVAEKVNFIFGRVMHDVLRDFLANVLLSSGQAKLFGTAENIKPSLKDLLKIYQERWHPYGFETKEEQQEYYQKGHQILENFYSNLEQEGWPQVQALEKSFSVKIGGYAFRGSIDRIDQMADGGVELIDYKTGSPKEKLDADHKRQLLLYQIAAEEALGLKVNRLTFYYLENGQRLSFTAKPEDLDKLKLSMTGQIIEMKKGIFTPKPSLLCSYCDFCGICEFRK